MKRRIVLRRIGMIGGDVTKCHEEFIHKVGNAHDGIT